MPMLESVLQFWFRELEPMQWWRIDPALDDAICDRFGGLLAQAVRAELFEWRASPQGRLAEIIVIDQFSRNVFRGDARAFAADPLALALSQEAVAAQADLVLAPVERAFLYMPYMHSESKAIHVVAERLYRERAPNDNYDFELKHKAIVDRFGRYPHRNATLGRESTPEELAFLAGPGSNF